MRFALDPSMCRDVRLLDLPPLVAELGLRATITDYLGRRTTAPSLVSR